MAAGPWFAVTTTEKGWTEVARVWFADGTSDEPAVLEMTAGPWRSSSPPQLPSAEGGPS